MNLIEYSVEIRNLSRREFFVSMKFAPSENSVRLSIPVWTPGSYLIREYSGGISSLSAEQDGTSLEIVREDKSHFTVRTNGTGSSVTVRYFVSATDLSVRKAWISPDRAFFTGAALFFSADGMDSVPCSLQILTPFDTVSTGLPSESPETRGRYLAESYDHLIDAPVLLSHSGETLTSTFAACGTPHTLVIAGCPEADIGKLTSDLQRICETEIRFWDPEKKTAPFENYTFLLSVNGRWGGLEHRNSVAAEAPAEAVPAAGGETPEQYTDLLALLAHEYFHAWNVKRLKPKIFLPYDLSKENYTSLLWFFEGFTEYYEEIILFRAGLLQKKDLLGRLSSMAENVFGNDGWKHQSLADASYESWIKYYRPDESSPHNTVSYYLGGAIFAFWLDLRIRTSSGEKHSLDDVMRKLWTECSSCGLSDDASEIIRATAGFCGISPEEAGNFFAPLFTPGTAPEWNDVLKREGLSHQAGNFSYLKSSAGIVFVPGSTEIKYARPDFPAALAGLIPKDTLIAVNGLKLTSENAEKLFRRIGTGNTAEIHFFRQNRLRTVSMRCREPAGTLCRFAEAEADSVPASETAWPQNCGSSSC